MQVLYRKNMNTVVEFNPNELSEAIVFVEAIHHVTGSGDVKNVVDTMRSDLAKRTVEELVHICEQCCTPIYANQLAVIKGDQRIHAQCPPMKPESDRDIN